MSSQNLARPEDALAELGKLSQLTQASLEPEIIPQVTVPMKTEVKVVAKPPIAPSPKLDPKNIQVSTRYQGKNIQDSSVLRALMDFHQSRAPTRGIKSTQKIPAQASNRPASQKSSFSPAEIPVIDAQPKNLPSVKRSNTPTHSILKKK